MDGKELDSFASYLADHSQRVAVKGDVSSTFPLKQGVPHVQGSCLGTILFTVYTSKVFDIVEKHLPSVHCHADDSQLYLAFSSNVPGDDEIALNTMCDCIKDLKDWMIRDQIKLNEDKTEFVIIGTNQQLEL